MKKRQDKYKDLLLTESWDAKRKKVFKRDGYRCQKCGTNSRLNCHHTYYMAGRKPWEYPLSALTTLCQECHTNLHAETKIRTRSSKPAKKEGGNKNEQRIKKLYNGMSVRDAAIQKRYDALK
jgi:5-methylcytosine-specific restriction endonuclease McrA